MEPFVCHRAVMSPSLAVHADSAKQHGTSQNTVLLSTTQGGCIRNAHRSRPDIRIVATLDQCGGQSAQTVQVSLPTISSRLLKCIHPSCLVQARDVRVQKHDPQSHNHLTSATTTHGCFECSICVPARVQKASGALRAKLETLGQKIWGLFSMYSSSTPVNNTPPRCSRFPLS